MKKWILLTLFFLALLLIAARFTKPNETDFLHLAQEKINAQSQEISTDPVMVDVVKIQKDFIMQALSKLLQSHDYYFFTTETIELGDGKYQYVGVMGTFIPLQKDNPLDKFYHNETH
jgi:hypothetical protein